MAKGTRNEGGCRSGIIRCWFWVAVGSLWVVMIKSASERGLGGLQVLNSIDVKKRTHVVYMYCI